MSTVTAPLAESRMTMALDGSARWRDSDGRLHRESGPALTWPDGTVEFWRHGRLHRGSDLPAIVFADGAKVWIVDGYIHRESGPAVIAADGSKQWIRHGVKQLPPPELHAATSPAHT
jgi:hypothetical protein